MKLFVVGISYRTAPVELREQLAVPSGRVRCAGCRMKIAGGLSEVVLLSTCNRVEIYGVTPQGYSGMDSPYELLAPGRPAYWPNLYLHRDGDAIRHLFSVAAGLDSMVVGETEITGQVKQAYEAACQSKLAGRVLHRVFQTAQHTVKEIRTRTGIGRGATSVGSVAVGLADKIFGTQLSERTVMIIGAGNMGESCVRHLAKHGARAILVANRSHERARELAAEFGGRAVRFDSCDSEMSSADIVVSSTGCPHIILHRAQVEQVMRARRNRPLVLIDIAVPRNIDPEVQSIPNVYLYNIDDLEQIVRENVRHREQELVQCRDIIARRVTALLDKLHARPERTYEPQFQPRTDWSLCDAFASVA